jgi:hypothetical protein
LRPAATAFAPRTPDQIRREGNHLVGAGSAYLREHAHNPVDWYSWGPEALALAVKLDRPIFLSIGYVSCHWCHVMEHESFERDDVAEFLNAHFISIKVDREERPDLDAAYMDAVEAMTGSGGWPMTVLLTPTLRPFFGGTYFPHDGLLQILHTADDQFHKNRSDVEGRGVEVYRRIASTEPAGDDRSRPIDLRAVATRALADVDAELGGFRGRAKFPTPVKWHFLLDWYRKSGDAAAAAALRKTLDAIDAGGIHDHVGGGFFRYATEPTWTVPHFEKMLYDNAQLAALYLEAGAALDEPRYEKIGIDTLDFLLRDMLTPEGGFGASFDADAGGKEGVTYLWTPSELRAIAGDDDGRVLATLLGVTDAGNFDGANVLTLHADRASAPGLAAWARWQPKLLEARQKRPQPSFDPKMVTSWNGLAIGALALGYRASGEHRFIDAATRAADAVWQYNRLPGGELARASDAAKPKNAGVLDDYAFLASGYVELFEATGDATAFAHALVLAAEGMAGFSNPKGAWFLTSDAAQEPLGRRMELSDGVEPSGNAAMILVLQRLAALTGRRDFETAAAAALNRYAGAMTERGMDMGGWLDGALLEAGPFYELVIVGKSGSIDGVWNHLLPPWTAGVRVDAVSPGLEKVMPTLAGKHDRDGVPLAYVCVRGACQEPTTDAVRVRSELLAGWMH